MNKITIKKKHRDIGKLLKDNNALFNYVHDECGYARGIVVAVNSGDRDNPNIGWAMFDEIEDVKCIIHSQAKQWDKFTTRMNGKVLDNETLIEFIKNYHVDNTSYNKTMELVPTKDQIYDLIILAISRAINTNRENYYMSDSWMFMYYTITNELCTLKTINADVELKYVSNYCIPEVKSICNCLRHAIRSMEYRAFKYFK